MLGYHKIKKETGVRPSNQLEGRLLGWYAACSSHAVNDKKLYHFSMFNDPLVLYRDKDSIARCIKDLCPHRGASFRGGSLISGELVCPYHGARFSSKGECTNLDRITCSLIVESNYDNWHVLEHTRLIDQDKYRSRTIYSWLNDKLKIVENHHEIRIKNPN